MPVGTGRAIAMLVATAASGMAGTAAAQGGGAVELGLFGRYTRFDQTLGFDNRTGGGARLGVFVSRHVSLEIDGSYTNTVSPTGGPAAYIPLHARALVHVPLGEWSALSLGPGYVRHEYRDGFTGSEDGAGGLFGVRWGVTRWLAFRTDVTADYIPTPVNAARDNWNIAGQIGFSLLLGVASRDADGDGVPDRQDACPGTAAAERVDAAGCPRDADRDGVADTSDRCPGTPARQRVDTAGCPVDSDGDGVVEEADRCPGTPSGERVDGRGCPLPADADGDGVPDAADRCAGTAAGERVDADGCPRDADGDGVRDAIDRCADTPAGTQVDAVGCRILFAPERTTLVLEGVTFATGSANLTEAARAILLTVGQSLAAHPEIRVEIAGHTDVTGSRATNHRLSQARAEAVRQYLMRSGVLGDRLVARGYGPDVPVATNATREGRAQNRRVELRRLN
jgi:outer membrane protein OmpA-like peptidoglycan-associated protein